MNKTAFQKISYGVYVISTWDHDRPTGCIANSVMQITSQPATIAISINHDNYTKQCIDESGVFAISILSEESEPSIIGNFGFRSGKDNHKFDSVSYEVINHLPVISDSAAYISCKIINKMETDTHTVFLGEVTDADLLIGNAQMTYDYYHKVVKGKSPKNAPTYIEKEAGDQVKEQYVCSICGYVYGGEIPFEELPSDYVCPICDHPKSDFMKKQV